MIFTILVMSQNLYQSSQVLGNEDDSLCSWEVLQNNLQNCYQFRDPLFRKASHATHYLNCNYCFTATISVLEASKHI